jgi:putative membrane protein
MKDLEEIKGLGYFSLSLSFIVLFIGILRFYQLKKHIIKIYGPFKESKAKETSD